ncbi:carboxylesterase family protein [Streptomyces sp. NPDC056190]|uniref:carboxylesterase family protein n=1 Tax=Streptomyces sp. NPDC056190 TaxID=3345741 RepID=UPI0035D9CC9A
MGDCLAFRGIRYAEAERFGPAHVVPLRDADPRRPRGPMPPQSPSRFDILMGAPAPLRQAEDCQVLSVYTPSQVGKRPVLVWFHGGAFITGGGELPWYDGQLLAVEQDVVVVTVTARLGVLGHLLTDGADHPSPATTDHMAAVEWVHRHIGEFGGDPDNITLFGQSAGGFAIDVMMRWGLGPHVKGAILQSAFLSQSDIIYHRSDVERLSVDFSRLLASDVRSATVDRLLEAQGEYARQAGRTEIWAPIRPAQSAPIGIPVIAGRTQHDAFPFLLIGSGRSAPDPGDFGRFGTAMDQMHASQIDEGNRQLAARATAHAQNAWLYELDWHVDRAGWGSPHCIDLPFLLGDHQAWKAAPMLRGVHWAALERQGRSLRTAWASFARERMPGNDWVPFDPNSPQCITRLEGACRAA